VRHVIEFSDPLHKEVNCLAMTFFQPDDTITAVGARLVSTILADNATLGLTEGKLCLTLAVYDRPGAFAAIAPLGAGTVLIRLDVLDG